MIDYTEIKEQFKEALSFSQGFSQDFINVDELFEKWYYAKKDFIENELGGNLILKVPNVSLKLQTKSKEDTFKVFLKFAGLKGGAAVSNYLKTEGLESFATNKTQVPYTISEEARTIPAGTSLLKSLKYFFKEDKETLRQVQDYGSMYINQKEVRGTLCFSVHPLDFLTLSDNASNWRSCHSLDGEHRSGNLNYMLDTTTIVCYLEDSHPYTLGKLTWNSKKWRMLLFISPNRKMAWAGRQYPFFTDSIFSLIPFGFNKSELWDNTNIKTIFKEKQEFSETLEYPVVVIGRNIFKKIELIKDAKPTYHYNDLLYSTMYEPYYYYDRGIEFTEVETLTIGAPVKCLHCGEDYICSGESFFCESCEADYGYLDNDEFGYCAYCDRHIRRRDGMWNLDDVFLCINCYFQEAEEMEREMEN